MIDSKDFPLVDQEAETKYEFDLQKSMALAKKRKLLAGVSILSTPRVIPGVTTLKMIIDSAGGTVNSIINVSIWKKSLARSLWNLQRRQSTIPYIT